MAVATWCSCQTPSVQEPGRCKCNCPLGNLHLLLQACMSKPFTSCHASFTTDLFGCQVQVVSQMLKTHALAGTQFKHQLMSATWSAGLMSTGIATDIAHRSGLCTCQRCLDLNDVVSELCNDWHSLLALPDSQPALPCEKAVHALDTIRELTQSLTPYSVSENCILIAGIVSCYHPCMGDNN